MPEILVTAARTLTERGRIYGDAVGSMTTTARLWSTVLGIDVTPTQVALCMIQLKVARYLVTPHTDGCVDIAGYAAILQACKKACDVTNHPAPHDPNAR